MMNTNSNNRKSTIRTVARTWIVTPIIATSFLIGTAPSFATIDNTATATGTPSSGVLPAATSNTVQIPVATAGPSLSVAKSVQTLATINLGINNAIADAGDQIVYQYIVTNNGNVTITSVKPVDIGPKFGTAQAAGTGTMGAFSPAPVTLIPGQAQTFTATYTLSQPDVDRAAGIASGPTAVNNSATATGTPASGTLGVVPPGTATTTIPAGPRLSIVKTFVLADVVGGTAGKADVGEFITYTYAVKNDGNVSITNVSISDTHEGAPVPAASITGDALVSDGPLAPGTTSTDATANNGIWSVLQPGATIKFTYTHAVTQTEFDAG